MNKWYRATRPTEDYLDLGGSWEYLSMSQNEEVVWQQPEGEWSLVEVPQQVQYGVNPEEYPQIVLGWYRKGFHVGSQIRQAVQEGNQVFLHLGGVAYRWKAWLNGQLLLDTYDALNPREINVTELLNLEGENKLVICAANLHGLRKEGPDARKPGRLGRDRDLLAPAPFMMTGWEPIIWGEVELWVRPASRIEDVFIRPDLRGKMLHLDLEVTGEGLHTVEIHVYNAEGECQDAAFDVHTVELHPGVVTPLTISGGWQSPRLWEPEDPYLYQVQVVLQEIDSQQVKDTQKLNFGFREIWIDGENIMMNGKRLFLARKSAIPVSEDTLIRGRDSEHQVSMKSQLEEWHKNAVNSLRLHIGGLYRPSAFASYTDELGIMLIPEANFVFSDRYALEDERFWKHYDEYLKRWIRRARNHPSIVMWSLCNEILWCGAPMQNPDSAQLMYNEEKMVKRLDPTRPVGWDGDWDLPPVGESETVNIHYPYECSDHWYPTECWDFESIDPQNPPHIRGHHRRYLWQRGTKPIIAGEFAWHWKDYLEAPGAMTKLGGDKVYDWDYWQDRNLHLKVIKWQCDAWRAARFAGINPWYNKERFDSLLPLETVILREQYRTFYSGQSEQLEGYLLNDTLRDRIYTVTWTIGDDTRQITKEEQQFELAGGEMKQFPVILDIPSIEKPEDYTLVIQVEREGKVVNTETYPIRIRPRPIPCWPEGVVLFDPSGRTGELLKQLKITPVKIDEIDSDLEAAGIVLGFGALAQLTPEQKKKLEQYVENGRNILVLGEDTWPEGALGLNTRVLSESKANHAWVRSPGHPALRGITDMDLALWRSGDWVCQRAFYKPDTLEGPAWRTLIDVGSRQGLEGAALLEVFRGKGRYMLNLLQLEKAVEEPGAAALLEALLKDMTRKPAPRSGVSLMMKKDHPIYQSAIKMNIAIHTWDPEQSNHPLFVDASRDEADPGQIRQWVRRGGTAWIAGINPSNLERWSATAEGGICLEECDPPEGCLIAAEDELLWGISSEELFWAEGFWDEQCVRDRRMKRLALIASYAVKAGEGGLPLVKPASLIKIKDGDGQWLLSTIDFEAGMTNAAKKTNRLIQGLFTNLGLGVDAGPSRESLRFLPISIHSYCNRGFQDDVAGDGRGGWSDQGPDADLRFFPINISGYDSAGLPMPAPSKEDWPSTMSLAGVEFEIIDPRINGGKSCIMLEPDYASLSEIASGDYLEEVEGISIDNRFKTLCSLHAAAYAQGETGEALWYYILHYEDGSEAELPVRLNMEAADWYNPRELSGARVAWMGMAMKLSPVGLYAARFSNPYPDKKVKTMDIVSARGKGMPGIIALTIGVDAGIK